MSMTASIPSAVRNFRNRAITDFSPLSNWKPIAQGALALWVLRKSDGQSMLNEYTLLGAWGAYTAARWVRERIAVNRIEAQVKTPEDKIVLEREIQKLATVSKSELRQALDLSEEDFEKLTRSLFKNPDGEELELSAKGDALKKAVATLIRNGIISIQQNQALEAILSAAERGPAVAARLAKKSSLVRGTLSLSARLSVAVEKFGRRFMPSFFSTGATKTFFQAAAITLFPSAIILSGAEVASGLLLGYTIFMTAVFLICKGIGKLMVRPSVKDLANLIRTDEDKSALRKAMEKQLPAQTQVALTARLSTRGVVI